jgi:hypothetical protein
MRYRAALPVIAINICYSGLQHNTAHINTLVLAMQHIQYIHTAIILVSCTGVTVCHLIISDQQ